LHLNDLDHCLKVFDGRLGAIRDDCGMALHAALAANKTVNMGIVNLFTQGASDSIRFSVDWY
jgi:hypothetical protein